MAAAALKIPDAPVRATRNRPKDRLAWLVKQGHISADHLELGERILRLAEAKDREPSPRMAFGGGGSGAGSSPALVRTAAGQRWDRLFTVAGPTGEAIVTAIIIDGMTTEEAAKYLNIHQKAVLHMLQYTLNILERS